MADHPNSKVVYLKRAQPFKHESMNSEVMQEQLSYTRRGLGSYFASKTSKLIGTGLNPKEGQILHPIFFNLSPSDKELRQNVDDWYIEINTDIPYGEMGRPFEIGLEESNEQPISETNVPIDIEQYMRYRHALKHPYVAASPELAAGNQLKLYFFEDPTKVQNLKLQEVQVKDEAFIDYQQAKDNMEKVLMLVSVLKGYLKPVKGKPKMNPKTASETELLIALRELADEHSREFHNAANDTKLKKRYFVDQLLEAGILRRAGTGTIQVVESGDAIGETINEAVEFLGLNSSSALLNSLKQQLRAEVREVKPVEEDSY